ncbi:MAG: EAL domain-containing protein, partial [Spirochaetaceae bacterium]|nr:EAL domain-containing protein [Spirochaetaceae bacterium]
VVAWQVGALATVVFGVSTILLESVVLYWLGFGAQIMDQSRIGPSVMVVTFTVIIAVIRHLLAERKEAHLFLKLSLSIADDGVWDWWIKEERVDYSPRWFTMLGYEPGELPGTYETFARLLHPDDKDAVEAIVSGIVAGPENDFQTDFRMRSKDDGYRAVLARGRVIERDWDGSALRMIGIHLDLSTRKRVEEEIVFYAYHNQLTGLPNRRSFYERLDESISIAKRSDTESHRGLIMLDIDDFKSVNDMHGPQIADQVIVAYAERLKSSIRESDYLFHLAGDDFCIVLNKLADETDIGVVADKIRRRSEEPLQIGDVSISICASMGLALYPRDGEQATGLASSAETALVEAKQERNTYRFYTEEMHTRIVERVKLIEELRESIRDERFTVYYQPIVDSGRAMVGAEALVRWNHPDAGLREPGTFVEIAEETGLIVDIGAQVIGRVCADLRKMIDLGHDPVPISVNLSVKQLSSKAVVGQIQRALSFHRIPVNLLALEITESSVMENMSTTLSTIETLILLGLKFSIDDFGTGYSSLSYLKRLPIHTVKIDRSFVKELPDSRKDAAIVRSVVAMAEGLELGLIAEGVENEDQEAFLLALGCSRMQGYLYGRPVPREQLEWLIEGGVLGGCGDTLTPAASS